MGAFQENVHDPFWAYFGVILGSRPISDQAGPWRVISGGTPFWPLLGPVVWHFFIKVHTAKSYQKGGTSYMGGARNCEKAGAQLYARLQGVWGASGGVLAKIPPVLTPFSLAFLHEMGVWKHPPKPPSFLTIFRSTPIWPGTSISRGWAPPPVLSLICGLTA